ncbi:MAG: type II secretion system F family protein [Actinophytocola sp.]|nr:type II secretion system F family protein [Actinophytocola sp.]
MTTTMLLYGGVAAIAMSIIAVVVTVLRPRPAEQSVSRALASIEETYAVREPSKADVVRARVDAMPGWLRAVALRLSPANVTQRLQYRLDLAGNPSAWTPDRILAAKGTGIFAFGGLGALYSTSFSVAWLVLCVGVGATFGFFLPDLLLINSGQKRQDRLRKALADALDMLTVCVEAGLGFDAALAQVERNTTGPLAAEFARVLREMQIGKSRTDALRAMTERTTVTELRAFVSALVQASELGIAMATVLREQAKELRLRRRQRAEEQAQKIPVKILFPVIFCIFPALFIVIIGPGAISLAATLLR